MRKRKKSCYICNEKKEILYRCIYEETFIKLNRIYGKWVFICSYCLEDIKKKYKKSYVYGGTWKSKKK